VSGAPDAADKAAVLVEAVPYIRRFWGKIVVVKYGGNVLSAKDGAEPVDVHRVDPDADHGAAPGADPGAEADHSTVTVLARFRGRSGSWPCRRASR